MKKLLSVLLAIAMLLTLAACGGKAADPDVGQPAEPGEEIHDPDAGQPAEPGEEEMPAVEMPTADAGEAADGGETGGDTLGQALLAEFNTLINSGVLDPQVLADSLVASPLIQFEGASMAVEPGPLTGFDAEITDFQRGVVFMPMIGTIPFVGYVFEVADAGAAADFAAKLEESANMRWNVCTEADEMVSGAAGNLVFFVMCSNQ